MPPPARRSRQACCPPTQPARRPRPLVLDSVAPTDLYLGNDFARNLESALDLQFARCGKTPDCVNAVGDPRAQLDALMARLETDPPLVTYRDASTGQSKQERLLPAHIAGLARMYAYSPMVSSILPLLIHEGAQGRYDGLMALSKMLGSQLSDQMAYGMQLSVVCSEDADGLQDDPDMDGSLLGNSLVSGLVAQCDAWPKGKRPDDFHQPLARDVPALLLCGEPDQFTPPAYAARWVTTLPNAAPLLLRGQGQHVTQGQAPGRLPPAAGQRRAGAAAVGRAGSGHPARVRRARGEDPPQRPLPGAARPGPQRDRRRLHAQAVRAVPRNRRRQGPGRGMPGQAGLHTTVHELQRVGALKRGMRGMRGMKGMAARRRFIAPTTSTPPFSFVPFTPLTPLIPIKSAP